MNSDLGCVGRDAKWSELGVSTRGGLHGVVDRMSLPGRSLEGIGDMEGSGRPWEMGHEQPSIAWSHQGQQGHPMARSTGTAAIGEEVQLSLGSECYQHLEGARMLGWCQNTGQMSGLERESACSSGKA